MRGDPALLGIMLRNLMDNALRYSPAGTLVTLAFAPDAITVSDHGPGVAPGLLPRLGDRFFRGAGQREQGNGLGISIARRVATLHGLSLTFDNLASSGRTGLLATIRPTGARRHPPTRHERRAQTSNTLTTAATPGLVFLIFLRLGLTSFGGPVAHLGYFREAFVTRRRWFSEQAYSDIVALCQFLPGPASSQVGMVIGLTRAGYRARAGGLAGLHHAIGHRADCAGDGAVGHGQPMCRKGCCTA